MKQIRYSRKISQFRNTARQINELIETGGWQAMSDVPQRQLQWKLNNLFTIVRNLLSRKELKKVLAAAVFLISISTLNAQSFAPVVNNPFGLTNTGKYSLPCLKDMDNDGDLDILSMAEFGVLKYYQNTGTVVSPSFAAPVTNPFGITYSPMAYTPVAADLDGDGDPDIITGEYYGAYKYFQNFGTAASPAYSGSVTNPFGLDSAAEIGFPALADFDDDGDLDLLSVEYYGAFSYFENTGNPTNPSFAVAVSNPFGLAAASEDAAFQTICDLDDDGDPDVLIGSMYNGGNFFFYRNTGTAAAPSFASYLLNPFGLTPTPCASIPSFGDIDDDGDYDLMVGDTTGDFYFFENTTISALSSFPENSPSFWVSPNPANDQVTINAAEWKKYTIKIISIKGELVYERLTENVETVVNTENFSKGIYAVEISNTNSVSRKKIIIE